MQAKIKKGDEITCIKDLVAHGGIILFTKGHIYEMISESCTINNLKYQHRFDSPDIFNKYFTNGIAKNEPIQPDYYKFNIKGVDCNMFDIGNALRLSLQLFSALKYFRVKGDVNKQINDLNKAKECIDLEIKNLKETL